jgi:hypothetical protein
VPSATPKPQISAVPEAEWGQADNKLRYITWRKEGELFGTIRNYVSGSEASSNLIVSEKRNFHLALRSPANQESAGQTT